MSEEIVNPRNLPIIPEADKRRALESTIYGLIGDKSSSDGDVQFYGHLLQSLSITFSQVLPTAGVYFDSKAKGFRLILNPNYFCALQLEQRKGLLLHELFHITFRHVYYNNVGYDKKILNVAMDMVINQYIKVLPDNCIALDKFKDKSGMPFPKLSTTEIYYELLTDGAKVQMPDDQKGQDDSEGEGNEQSEGQGYPKEFEAEKDGQGNVWVKASELFKEREFDVHDWGDDAEADSLEKMEALKDLVKRTMQKTSFGYSRAPKMIEDLLIKLDATIQQLNYKQILLSTLKKSLPSKDIEKTWVRPSRRYGDLAKGNRLGKMPTVEFLIDTSGSISMEEANELLKVTNNFMTVGVEKAHVHLWADDIYFSKRIRKNFQLQESDFKSGGTDLLGVLDLIKKKKPDLAVIMTDGYYGRPDFNYKSLAGTNVVFIITKQGQVDHPLKDIGKTVKY